MLPEADYEGVNYHCWDSCRAIAAEDGCESTSASRLGAHPIACKSDDAQGRATLADKCVFGKYEVKP